MSPDELGTVARQVYDCVVAAGEEGLLCEEVERKTGLRHQTVSARLRELVDAGLLRERSVRRQTSSGRKAAPYVGVTRPA
jgi:predicted transcriptional regulator